MASKRVYIETTVVFSAEGRMTPVKIRWTDGREFEIDRVLEVRRSVSETGIAGVRYTVLIMGQERRLYFEGDLFETGQPRWFIEMAC